MTQSKNSKNHTEVFLDLGFVVVHGVEEEEASASNSPVCKTQISDYNARIANRQQTKPSN